ncbi:MAG: hypothetical protein AB7G28_04980 [Pirellulales bacterium]
MRRSAFTLFELILAIALSVTLLALIGTAVNLYLVRMDTGRTRVEEAQLARSILDRIAADIRATTVYQTQDISQVQQLAQQSANGNDIVSQFGGTGAFTQSGLGTPGTTSTTGSTGTTTSIGGSSGGTTTGGGSSGAGGASSGSSGGMGGSSSDGTSPTGLKPGLNGLTNELMLDVVELPRLDEMYPTVPQQASSFATAANAAALPKPSDLKSVRYFIRQGATVDASDPAATLLSPADQLKVGGLVRQTIDRAIRQMAEQTANSQILNSGQMLLAPEVTQIQFIYFDGTQVLDQWDMSQAGAMPTAVDVRIWIAPDPIDAEASETPLQPRMYNQTVELPLAQAAGNNANSANSSQQQSGSSGNNSSQNPSGSTTGGGDDDTESNGFGI